MLCHIERSRDSFHQPSTPLRVTIVELQFLKNYSSVKSSEVEIIPVISSECQFRLFGIEMVFISLYFDIAQYRLAQGDNSGISIFLELLLCQIERSRDNPCYIERVPVPTFSESRWFSLVLDSARSDNGGISIFLELLLCHIERSLDGLSF